MLSTGLSHVDPTAFWLNPDEITLQGIGANGGRSIKDMNEAEEAPGKDMRA